MMKLNVDQAARTIIAHFAIGIAVVGLIAVAIVVKLKDSDPKDKFTPEQKAVLSALSSARAEVAQAKAELEKTKREINDLITSFRGAALAKGVDPNVQVTWLPMDGNPVNCGGNPQNLAQWGFRADGTVTWKCP